MTTWFVIHLLERHFELKGPYSLDQIRRRLMAGRLAFCDLLYQPDRSAKWIRIDELDGVADCEPPQPTAQDLVRLEKEIKEKSAGGRKDSPTKTVVREDPIWSLQSGGKEYGPFSVKELGNVLSSGKLRAEKFAWKHGMKNWLKIENLEDLLLQTASKSDEAEGFVIERGRERRVQARSSLIATVTIQTDDGDCTGICSDVSKSGFQVSKLVAKMLVGEKYEIIITPLVATKVKPYPSVAVLAWFDEKKQTAGFGFVKSIEKSTIIRYLTKQQKGYKVFG
jgi:hypothetical protein